MKTLFANHELSLQPLWEDICQSRWATLRSDLLAGLNVALLTMPQVMAYALMAGLPLTCGLFGSVFATLIAALLGSSRHLIVGPTNTIAILVLTGTSAILYTHYREVVGWEREQLALQIVAQLTLMVGVLQVIAAFSGLGRLTQFVSYSVVVGYMTGTAMALTVNQLFVLCGVETPEKALSVCQNAAYLLTHIGNAQGMTLLVGLFCLLFFLYARRLPKCIPATGIILVISAAFFYLWRQYPVLTQGIPLDQVKLVGDAGNVVNMVPQFISFQFDMGLINLLFPSALAIALLGMLEANAIGKAAATKSGQQLSIDQDIFGLGLGNLFSGLLGAMPSSGSPSRTALNYATGAQTRFAAVFSSCALFLMVFAFGQAISYIPLSAFAALLIVTAFGLVDRKQFMLCLRTHPTDASVLIATILACVIFSVDVAFFIGIGLSITCYLNKAATPYLIEHLMGASGDLLGTERPGVTRDQEIRMISVQGELFFGAVDLFQTTVKALAAGDQRTRVLILQLKHARDVDATACVALQQVNRYLQESGRHLVCCSITTAVWEVLCNSGVADEIRRENLFLYNPHEPHLAVRRAWQRARQLADQAPAKVPIEIASEPVLEAISR